MTKQKQIQTWTYIYAYVLTLQENICLSVQPIYMWYILDTYASCGVWTCSPLERAMYIITFMTIITYILNYIKCKNGRVICKEHEEIIIWYTHFSLTLRIILKTSSTICLLEGDRGRSIWKVKTFFLMSTPYVMKSLPSEYYLCRRRFFQDSTNESSVGFWIRC